MIAIGTNTDPYQPIERDRRIMRGLLEVLRDHAHPVAVTTKGVMVERDADLLAELGPDLTRVGLSVTTLDPDLARALEPRVPTPARRLKAIERLARAGVQVRVMVSPVIPGLTDHELESVLRAAADAGAVAASMIPLRLPLEVAPLFEEWLRASTSPTAPARCSAGSANTTAASSTMRASAPGCGAGGSMPTCCRPASSALAARPGW